LEVIMTLESVLQKAEYIALSSEDALDALLADGAPLTNTELQTVAAVVKAVGQEATALVLGTIKAVAAQNPLVDGLYLKLCTVGQDWSDTEWQAAIPQYAALGSWPSEVTAALLAMGSVPRKQWQVEGLTEAPTLETIQAVQDADLQRQRIAYFVNEILQPAITRGDSIAELQALAADADNWIP